MKRTVLRVAVAALTFGTLFTACREKNDPAPSEDYEAVDEQSANNSYSDDVLSVVESVIVTDNSSGRVKAGQEMSDSTAGPRRGVTVNQYCNAEIAVTPATDSEPGTVVINFGTGGKSCDGKIRKGKISISFNGGYRAPGTTQTITFDKYSVDGVTLSGNYLLVHAMGANNTSVVTTISARDMEFTDLTGKKATWNSELTRTRDTKGTATPADDEYSVSGTVVGRSPRGAFAAGSW